MWWSAWQGKKRKENRKLNKMSKIFVNHNVYVNYVTKDVIIGRYNSCHLYVMNNFWCALKNNRAIIIFYIREKMLCVAKPATVISLSIKELQRQTI